MPGTRGEVMNAVHDRSRNVDHDCRDDDIDETSSCDGKVISFSGLMDTCCVTIVNCRVEVNGYSSPFFAHSSGPYLLSGRH
jgi:predicted molibdopterin-dependent oxidoreductase YjgC